jgi:hypothetical protein
MYLQLSQWGGRNFCVNYSSIPLFTPKAHLGWIIGGRFPCGKSHDGWWSAKTPNRADDSMKMVAATFESFARPWFEQTATVETLLTELLRFDDLPNPHIQFEIGCCLAWLSDGRSFTALERARQSYKTSYDEMPARDWCLQCITYCDLLLAAVADGSSREVLDRWMRGTAEALKLKRLKSFQVGQLGPKYESIGVAPSGL